MTEGALTAEELDRLEHTLRVAGADSISLSRREIVALIAAARELSALKHDIGRHMDALLAADEARGKAEAERNALREALEEANLEVLTAEYNNGFESSDGRWHDSCLSGPEWLAGLLGLGPGFHDAEAVKAALPALAKKLTDEVSAAAIRSRTQETAND